MDNVCQADKRVIFASHHNQSASSTANAMGGRTLASDGITTMPTSNATCATTIPCQHRART